VAPTSGGERAARRVFDVVGASVMILLTLPLLLGAIVAVALFSGRPVFYGHPRVGRGGRTFRCWKLRTMELRAAERLRVDHELAVRYRENGYKLPADPRATVPGRILRRLYLDELPQLFNVLWGTMSLVGPRPVVPDELEEYGEGVAELLSQRPGIFGAWNSLGRNRPSYPERARVELEYVRTRTLQRDLRILVRSLPVVLRGFPEDV
jgi:lipopolysaccharide/colanic/teichoic acid biosynthesis glycosyltransferase